MGKNNTPENGEWRWHGLCVLSLKTSVISYTTAECICLYAQIIAATRQTGKCCRTKAMHAFGCSSIQVARQAGIYSHCPSIDLTR